MQRRILLSFFLAVAVVRLSVAQAPQSISYQAVARDDQGHALVNQAVRFRFSLLQGSSGGAAVYVETHTVTTNEFGLANLSIGAGTVSAGNFSTIDWGAANYWLKVELDPQGGASYSEMGTSQLLSVPYALYAKTAGVDGSETIINAGTNVSVTGSGTEASPYVINSTASANDPASQVALFDEFVMTRTPVIFPNPPNSPNQAWGLGSLGWEYYKSTSNGSMPSWNDDAVVLPNIGLMKFGLYQIGTSVAYIFLKNVLKGNTPDYTVEFLVKQEYTGTSGGPSHFRQRIGLMQLVTSPGQADPNGVYFKQDASNTWWAVCKNGSATVANTSVSQSTNFTKFTIVMNSAGNSATFYINGASVATIAANIPSSSLAACYFTEAVDFSGSSADRHFYIDYFKMNVTGLTR
jgi:hypothetical protein